MMDRPLADLAIATIKVNDVIARQKVNSIINVYVFEQIWASTALGFSGWGGSSMTPAWTHVVLTTDGKYHVFFDGRYAYTIENPTEKFKEDLVKQFMASVKEAKELY